MLIRTRLPLLQNAWSVVEIGALSAGLLALKALPLAAALELGRAMGRAYPLLMPRYRQRARENLRCAYPEVAPEWIERTATESFEHFGQAAMETLKGPRTPGDRGWEDVVEVRGDGPVLEALKAGRGVIFSGGHFGNWEIAVQWAAVRGIRVTSVAHRLENPWVERLVTRERRARGNTTVEIDGAFRALIRALREGGVVAVLTDRNPRDQGMIVPFFGRDILTVTTPALLSCVTGAPIVPFACIRQGRAFRYTLHYGDPLFPDSAAPRGQEVERLTRASTAALERYIRLAPGQWQWMHRRWKITPGGRLRAGIGLHPAMPAGARGADLATAERAGGGEADLQR